MSNALQDFLKDYITRVTEEYWTIPDNMIGVGAAEDLVASIAESDQWLLCDVLRKTLTTLPRYLDPRRTGASLSDIKHFNTLATMTMKLHPLNHGRRGFLTAPVDDSGNSALVPGGLLLSKMLEATQRSCVGFTESKQWSGSDADGLQMIQRIQQMQRPATDAATLEQLNKWNDATDWDELEKEFDEWRSQVNPSMLEWLSHGFTAASGKLSTSSIEVVSVIQSHLKALGLSALGLMIGVVIDGVETVGEGSHDVRLRPDGDAELANEGLAARGRRMTNTAASRSGLGL